jgi:uncharacterized membrane protein
MSHDLYLWVKGFHVVGVLIWGGTLMGLANLLVLYGRANPAVREALLPACVATARMMEIGAVVAIGCAIWIAVGSKALSGAAWPMKQPWMHVKLTLVVVGLFSSHGLLRAKLGKYRRGKQTKALPPAIVPIMSLTLIAIVLLAVARPLG